MVLDYNQLVIDNEFVRMIRRVMQGIPVNDYSLAMDVIKNVGPRGHFLMEDHTLENMRNQSDSKIFDRNTRAEWKDQGSSDLNTRAHKEVLEILQNYKPKPLTDKVATRVRELVEYAEKQFVR